MLVHQLYYRKQIHLSLELSVKWIYSIVYKIRLILLVSLEQVPEITSLLFNLRTKDILVARKNEIEVYFLVDLTGGIHGNVAVY